MAEWPCVLLSVLVKQYNPNYYSKQIEFRLNKMVGHVRMFNCIIGKEIYLCVSHQI